VTIALSPAVNATEVNSSQPELGRVRSFVHSARMAQITCLAASKSETFDDAEANALIGREHRKGFDLPKI
jgi:hypothetical protein